MVTCDSGAGEESPPPPPLLRTPSMMRLAMVSPTARVVAPGWRVRGGGRRRLARPVAMGVQDLAKRGARLVGGGRERVYQCRRRDGGVWFVSRSTPDSGSGARIQKTGGLVVAARPPSVRPAVQISQKPLRGLQMQRARDTAQVRRGAGTWSFSCFRGSIVEPCVEGSGASPCRCS